MRDDAAPPARRICLGIIGTAGRGTDAPKLTQAVFDRMCAIARQVVIEKSATSLVSGGAAWGDQVAVQLVLDGVLPPAALRLHLPAPFLAQSFDPAYRDGATSNRYHLAFSDRVGRNTLHEIAEVIRLGAEVRVNPLGFKPRNLDVAGDAGILLAFTFGTGVPWQVAEYGNVPSAAAGLRDGGTAHTFSASRASTKIHVTLT